MGGFRLPNGTALSCGPTVSPELTTGYDRCLGEAQGSEPITSKHEPVRSNVGVRRPRHYCFLEAWPRRQDFFEHDHNTLAHSPCVRIAVNTWLIRKARSTDSVAQASQNRSLRPSRNRQYVGTQPEK